MRNKLKSTLTATAVGTTVLMAFGALPASAGEIFTVAPSAITGSGSNVTGTELDGTSSALITMVTTDGGTGGPTSTETETGAIYFNLIKNGNIAVANVGSPLGTYGLVLSFNATSTTTLGTVGGSANTNVLNTLTFTLSADPKNDDALVAASSHTAPSFTDPSLDDQVLATGSLISGVATFDANGGPAFNSLLLFDLCTSNGFASQGGITVPDAACKSGLGQSYFISPMPFYYIAFEESNTNPTNLFKDINFPDAVGSTAWITTDTVEADFARAVPEPSTLSLLGVGLIGLGGAFGARRRRNKLMSS